MRMIPTSLRSLSDLKASSITDISVSVKTNINYHHNCRKQTTPNKLLHTSLISSLWESLITHYRVIQYIDSACKPFTHALTHSTYSHTLLNITFSNSRSCSPLITLSQCLSHINIRTHTTHTTHTTHITHITHSLTHLAWLSRSSARPQCGAPRLPAGNQSRYPRLRSLQQACLHPYW